MSVFHKPGLRYIPIHQPALMSWDTQPPTFF